MIGSTRKVRVLVHRQVTDMRKSFDTLAGVIHQEMNEDVMTGDLYLFVGKDRKRAKVLFFDGTGMCLYAKRLSRGRFIAPWDGTLTQMTHSELALFLEGAEVVRAAASPAALVASEMLLPKGAFS